MTHVPSSTARPKRRITPVSMAPTSAPARVAQLAPSAQPALQAVQQTPPAEDGVPLQWPGPIAPVAPAPWSQRSAATDVVHRIGASYIPRTLPQLLTEINQQAESIGLAAEAWHKLQHVELVYGDLEDIDAIIVGAKKLKRCVEEYQMRAKEVEAYARAVEAKRRTELVPVMIDPEAGADLYRKYRAQLADGNSKLYRCPLADPETGKCSDGAGCASNPGKKATIAKHILRKHIKSETKRKQRHGYGVAIAEGWVSE